VEDTVVGKRKNKESNFVFNQTVKLVAIHSVNFSFIQFRCFQRFQQLQCPLFLLLGFVIFPLFSIFISFHNFYQFSIFISVSHGTITQFGCFFLNLYTKLINLIFYFGASWRVIMKVFCFWDFFYISSSIIEKCIFFLLNYCSSWFFDWELLLYDNYMWLIIIWFSISFGIA
jgi:hypothetical protein